MSTAAYILPSSEIDHAKWNNCIQGNSNGLIYSFTGYLDAMADQWHGIVIGDYRAVMAIPWRVKLGFRYAYMPAFMQQLGLTGDYAKQDIKAILRTLPDFLSLADMHFNFSNSDVKEHTNLTEKTNLILGLSQGYDEIYTVYRKDLKENLRKNNSLSYEAYSPVPAIELFRELYFGKMQGLQYEDFEKFTGLCNQWQNEGKCITRCVKDKNQAVLATAVILKDSRRIYNIMNAVPETGRLTNANDFLLDRVIHEFAGQDYIFDFEGSELPGVKSFYEKFGAINQPYFYYRYNGLPWYLRLFKR